jgi:XapX domain-containing protein
MTPYQALHPLAARRADEALWRSYRRLSSAFKIFTPRWLDSDETEGVQREFTVRAKRLICRVSAQLRRTPLKRTSARSASRSVQRTLQPEVEPMKPYIISLAAGLLVGIVYSLLHVRSPAPPLVALVGLLGILGGEQVIPLAKQMLAGVGFHTAWQESKCTQHLFGSLPGGPDLVRRNVSVANTDTPEKKS